MDLIAPRVICVGTHHKTGTVWMRQVFRALSEATGIPQHGAYGQYTKRFIKNGERVILFNWSSQFHENVLTRPDARILHVIRDPRDVLLSGMRYHQVAPEGGEKFLHTPQDALGGQTYQQHINALSSDIEKLLFEMDGKHAETLEQMLRWDATAPNTIEARYEDLMQDTTCTLFREILRDLGLPELEVAKGVQIFWDKSLFGGAATDTNRTDRLKLHIASGQTAQWRSKLPRAVAEPYAEKYGQALVELGYEPHPTAWLQELSHAA